MSIVNIEKASLLFDLKCTPQALPPSELLPLSD